MIRVELNRQLTGFFREIGWKCQHNTVFSQYTLFVHPFSMSLVSILRLVFTTVERRYRVGIFGSWVAAECARMKRCQ